MDTTSENGNQRPQHATGDEAGGVRHIHEAIAFKHVADGAHPLVAVLPRVGTGSNQFGAEYLRRLLKRIAVDVARLGRHTVGKGFEVDGGRNDLLWGVEAVGEMAAAGEIEPHDVAVRLGSRWNACKARLFAKGLNHIDVFCTTIVATANLSLRVFVR